MDRGREDGSRERRRDALTPRSILSPSIHSFSLPYTTIHSLSPFHSLPPDPFSLPRSILSPSIHSLSLTPRSIPEDCCCTPNTCMQQGDVLVQQGDVLVQQGDVLVQQGDVLVQQGDVLVQQGDVLVQQGGVLVQQGRACSRGTCLRSGDVHAAGGRADCTGSKTGRLKTGRLNTARQILD